MHKFSALAGLVVVAGVGGCAEGGTDGEAGGSAPEAPMTEAYYNPATGATCAQRESRCCWPKCDPQPVVAHVEPAAACTYPCSDPWPTPPLAAPDSPAGRDYCGRYPGAPYCAG